jgi:phage tail-like protein
MFGRKYLKMPGGKWIAWIAVTSAAVGIVCIYATHVTGGEAGSTTPSTALYYTLEVEGEVFGFFTEVSGIGWNVEVATHTTIGEEGTEVVSKFPGSVTYSDVTLKRRLTTDMNAWNWRRDVIEGNIQTATKYCTIVAFRPLGGELGRWYLSGAWPSKLVARISEDESSAIEELTLTVREQSPVIADSSGGTSGPAGLEEIGETEGPVLFREETTEK